MSAPASLLEAATKARMNAHSPYSGFKVGAAIRTASGHTYTGCNVENSSYGATVCAERVAIQKAISEEGKVVITEVVVVTDSTPPWPPCGMCRQVIAEFASATTPVAAANLKGETKSWKFSDLMPEAFTSANLKN